MQDLRILHLEDDPFFADMVEDLLKSQGMRYRVRRAETWDAFESALQDSTYDLIVSDHQIPGGDGLKALSLCRRVCPSVPFIFLSGQLGEELAIESLKNGAADYVLKSNISRFIPMVLRALSAFRETAALRAAEARIRRDQANLHGLIENTTDAIWSMDLDFNILVFNSAASLLSLKMTGHPMVEGSCLLERLAPGMQDLWKEAGHRIRKGDRFIQELELEWSGRNASLEISFHPIFTGKLASGMAVFGKDVTERNRVDADGRAIEEMRRRLAGLYRKMRIPLHGLGRIAALMGRTSMDEAQRRYMDMLRFSLQRISDLHEKTEAESGFERAHPGLSAPSPADPRQDPVAPPGPRPWARKPKAAAVRPEGVDRRKKILDPLRILVVEDNAINQIVVKGYLHTLGLAAEVASNGREAVEAYRGNGFDLILMDCQMPVMDGYEATLAIRALEAEAGTGSHAWIAAMTANVMPGAREKCLSVGMDSYMSKPLQVDRLKQEAEHAEARREARLRSTGKSG